MGLLWVFSGLGLILAPLTAAQRVVYTTSTTTFTELVVCTTTQYTTLNLNVCPCTAIFPAITPCTSCQTCSTTLISTTSGSGPTPTGDEFTVDLTIGLDTGEEVVTLSRVGNTVGIGGTVLVFNLSDSGLLRDAYTGDTVYVILPDGALRKRFEGSVDLLIGPTPPSSASIMTWSRTSQGELEFIVGKGSGNAITLSFGVALTDGGQIDTTVPIQMYDVAEGVPTDIETGVATQSVITGSQTITRSGESPSTISPSSSSSQSTSSQSSDTSSDSSDSTISTRYITITQYGPTPGISTSILANGYVYVIIIRQQETRSVTLYGPDATTTTGLFDQYDPTITVFDVSSQVVTTTTIYGSLGYTSTPTIGSMFPTLTAFAEIPQVTITNATYGPAVSTISFEPNSSIPTITIWIQLTATTTITTTTYVWNQAQSALTSTQYGTVPTATVIIFSSQYRIFTTVTAPFDFTTTIGPDNPTATISEFISPNVTFTEPSVTLHWNWTVGQSSTETPSQTPSYTRTVILHLAYPPASYVRFQATDANPAAPQFFAAARTAVDAYTATPWYIVTRPTTRCMFIFVDGQLILATDPESGNRLPVPWRMWTYWDPIATNGDSVLMFVSDIEFEAKPGIKKGLILMTTVSASADLLTVQSRFMYNVTALSSANFYYNAATAAATGNNYTPRFISTVEAGAITSQRRNSVVQSTMFSFTASAPTA